MQQPQVFYLMIYLFSNLMEENLPDTQSMLGFALLPDFGQDLSSEELLNT
jgi:hypothetical protein